MKMEKVIDLIGLVFAALLIGFTLFEGPIRREVVQYEVQPGNEFVYVTYQSKNIFGMDVGEELTFCEPIR